jgi:hypothetical protein
MAGLSEDHPWSDADAGRLSEVERRVAPLQTSASVALGLAVVATSLGALLSSRAETTVDTSIGPGVVTSVLGSVLVVWAGFSATAY